jgi:hypothetical protein
MRLSAHAGQTTRTILFRVTSLAGLLKPGVTHIRGTLAHKLLPANPAPQAAIQQQQRLQEAKRSGRDRHNSSSRSEKKASSSSTTTTTTRKGSSSSSAPEVGGQRAVLGKLGHDAHHQRPLDHQPIEAQHVGVVEPRHQLRLVPEGRPVALHLRARRPTTTKASIWKAAQALEGSAGEGSETAARLALSGWLARGCHSCPFAPLPTASPLANPRPCSGTPMNEAERPHRELVAPRRNHNCSTSFKGKPS